MNRASFIKSLFVVAAAPKIISQIDLSPVNPTSTVLAQLDFIMPMYYQKMIEKYGNTDYEWWLAAYSDPTTTEHKNQKEYLFYENGIIG